MASFFEGITAPHRTVVLEDHKPHRHAPFDSSHKSKDRSPGDGAAGAIPASHVESDAAAPVPPSYENHISEAAAAAASVPPSYQDHVASDAGFSLRPSYRDHASDAGSSARPSYQDHVASDAVSTVRSSYQNHVASDSGSSALPSYQDHVDRAASADHTGSVYSVNPSSTFRSKSGAYSAPQSKEPPPPVPPRKVKAAPPVPPRKNAPPHEPAFDPPQPPSYEQHSRSSGDGGRGPSYEEHKNNSRAFAESVPSSDGARPNSVRSGDGRRPSYEEHNNSRASINSVRSGDRARRPSYEYYNSGGTANSVHSGDGARRPSYDEHIRAADDSVPSYEEHRRVSVDSVRRSPPTNGGGVGVVSEEAAVVPEEEADQAPSQDREVVKAEMRRVRWAMFVVGNMLSAAIVLLEISKLSVCFDERVGDDDDETEPDAITVAIDSDATFTYVVTMFTLVFGFWVELLSTFALSAIYRSPLDIKSVHKVPPDDLRHCGASIIVNFLAPFSWAMIYLFGGLASVYHSANSSCKGQGGSGLELYLLVSGSFMTFTGLGLLALSGVISIFSCGSPTRSTDRCCSVARRKIHNSILSKGPFFHVFWQIQGAIWSYRAGGFGIASTVFVGFGGVFGELLSAFGSTAPDVVVDALAGSIA